MTPLALFTLLAAADADQAVRAEQAAFVAVDEKRWCDAMALFVEANAYAPTGDLIFNAARAAELANDRRLAVLLYTEVLGTNSKQRRRVEAKRKLSTIAALVESDGPGTPCTPPSREPSFDDIIVAVTDPAPPTLAEHRAEQIASLASKPPVALEPPPGGVAAQIDVARLEMPPWSTVAFGAGGALLVGGAVTAAIGAAPWVDYVAAQGELRSLEEERSRDVEDVYRRQVIAEINWNTFGKATFSTGAAVMVAGAALVATGGVLRAQEEEGDAE